MRTLDRLVERDAPTVPLVTQVLQAHRHELMRRDLPGRFLSLAANAGEDPVFAALGEFTHEYRENRAEALARDSAEGLGTSSSQFGENLMKLLLNAQVATGAELAKVWQAVAAAPKKLERSMSTTRKKAPIPLAS